MHARHTPARRDKHRVVDAKDFDVQAFASSHGLIYSQALGLVDRFGTDLDRLEREALNLDRA